MLDPLLFRPWLQRHMHCMMFTCFGSQLSPVYPKRLPWLLALHHKCFLGCLPRILVLLVMTQAYAGTHMSWDDTSSDSSPPGENHSVDSPMDVSETDECTPWSDLVDVLGGAASLMTIPRGPLLITQFNLSWGTPTLQVVDSRGTMTHQMKWVARIGWCCSGTCCSIVSISAHWSTSICAVVKARNSV